LRAGKGSKFCGHSLFEVKFREEDPIIITQVFMNVKRVGEIGVEIHDAEVAGRRFGQAGVGESIDQVMESELDAEQGERRLHKLLFEPWITGTNQNRE
jgi:hypothetical protein